MKPSLRNLFMKKLTRERVVPIISASVSWLILAMIGSGLPSLPKFASSRSSPRQALLARIEQLVDQILLDPDRARQEMGNEHLGERRLVMDHADDGRLLEPHDLAVRHGRDGRDAPRLPGKTPSPKNSSAPRIATTASLPCSETTVTLTLPFWM